MSFTGWEKDPVEPDPVSNPFEGKVDWNGFAIGSKKYQTPFAILEIWGETDSMSADFDISLTDGAFNSDYRVVSDYEIMVYFDINSPSLDEISEGTYYIENTNERKPGIIVESYIMLSDKSGLQKYPVIEGSVDFQEQSGFIFLDYSLKIVKDREITYVFGKYTGLVIPYDQTINQ